MSDENLWPVLNRIATALETIAAAQRQPPATDTRSLELYRCQYSGCDATYWDMEDLRGHRRKVHGE